MHIETHAKETVAIMTNLIAAMATLEYVGRHDISALTTEDLEKATAAFKELREHLFDYQS